MILTEICQNLRNWFDRDQKKWRGKLEIIDGELYVNDEHISLQTGQYFRIIGSLFNDGVHVYGENSLVNELPFSGAVWSMAVPPAVIALAGEIEEWQQKYGSIDSTAMSPFSSESFGGYSYSKSGGSSSDGSAGAGGGWQSVFAKRLNAWRKI